MEYGDYIDYIEGKTDSLVNSDLYTKHVGFQDTNPCIEKLFNKHTVYTISAKITQLLMGVHPQNRPIIVPNNTIYNVMDNIYQSYRPRTGDIYGRYNVPSGYSTDSYVQDIIDQVIEVIVSDVKTTYDQDENNKKLSAWTTVLGDFNDHQLRSHPIIKTRLKRPAPMQFNMNY